MKVNINIINLIYLKKLFFIEISENDTCYYDESHDVTFVKWKYNDKKLDLSCFMLDLVF